MAYVTQDEWDTHYREGRSFRPLDDVERTLFRDLSAARPGGRHALDVGCGTGELARHLAALGYTVDAVDYAASALATAARTPPAAGAARFVRCDIERDSLAGLRSWYDLIVFRLSYAFLRDRTRVMNRLRERLSPRGAIVVITPVVDAVPAERREIALDEDEIGLLAAGWRTVERRAAEGLALIVLRDPVRDPAPAAVSFRDKGRPSPHALTGAGVVVTDDAGRVLLGRSVRGVWELPGGKNDGDESFVEAAVRELEEETGLRAETADARLLALLMDSVHGMPRVTAAVRVVAFRGEPAVREPKLIHRWEWHDVRDLPTLASGLFTPSAHVLDVVWPGKLPGLPPVHHHALVQRNTHS
ncbi:bifunctional class I SAM-dependent methyltransferase/NUDIX hydrolase [Streptomyces caniferus]|uniref:bifunctional class I SAM-dependent methyltransferase/NUDIX hydrolase n=1 Tax=Streptomyces caniferus TaxID=285557 RepID=UPI0037F7A554